MRDSDGPLGFIYRFAHKSTWNEEALAKVNLSKLYRTHLVVVLGFAGSKDWVWVATITSTIPKTSNPDKYLPIFPHQHPESQNNSERARVPQLRLCGNTDKPTFLTQNSYVRLEDMAIVPRSILVEALREDGFKLSLKGKSFAALCRAAQLAQKPQPKAMETKNWREPRGMAKGRMAPLPLLGCT